MIPTGYSEFYIEDKQTTQWPKEKSKLRNVAMVYQKRWWKSYFPFKQNYIILH
jgi:hypothetical protein